MPGFLAYIVPVDTGYYPAHPIAPGGPPPGIWGPTDPRPGYGLPPPLGTWGGSGAPLPGYGLPQPPPGIWGPTDPRPGYGLPGSPPGTWGGSGTPMPQPPIVIPPTSPGQPPLVIWGGSGTPMPTPPIELPGGGTPPPGGEPVKIVEWKTAWTPSTGWVVVGVPQAPHPAPA